MQALLDYSQPDIKYNFEGLFLEIP